MCEQFAYFRKSQKRAISLHPTVLGIYMRKRKLRQIINDCIGIFEGDYAVLALLEVRKDSDIAC